MDSNSNRRAHRNPKPNATLEEKVVTKSRDSETVTQSVEENTVSYDFSDSDSDSDSENSAGDETYNHGFTSVISGSVMTDTVFNGNINVGGAGRKTGSSAFISNSVMDGGTFNGSINIGGGAVRGGGHRPAKSFPSRSQPQTPAKVTNCLFYGSVVEGVVFNSPISYSGNDEDSD